jgi:hypothetical protein
MRYVVQNESALKNSLLGIAKDVREVENRFDRMSRVGERLTVGLTAPLLAGGVALMRLSANAIESENLVKESFGGMLESANTWSKGLSSALGLNEYEVRRQAATFNVMFNSMGLAENKAFDMSKGLTKLAYDMSSFYNLRPEEAFEKLSAGITGEAEPLKRLGILINEETIKQYAYAKGIAAAGSELSEQEKVLARYGAIMQQTTKAQGDLERTKDSPANMMRQNMAELQKAGIDAGMALQPLLSEGLKFANSKIIPAVKEGVDLFVKMPEPIRNTAIALALAAGPALKLAGAIKSIKQANDLAKIAQLAETAAEKAKIPVAAAQSTALSLVGDTAVDTASKMSLLQRAQNFIKAPLVGDAALTRGSALIGGALGIGAGVSARSNMQAAGYSDAQSNAYGAATGAFVGAVNTFVPVARIWTLAAEGVAFGINKLYNEPLEERAKGNISDDEASSVGKMSRQERSEFYFKKRDEALAKGDYDEAGSFLIMERRIGGQEAEAAQMQRWKDEAAAQTSKIAEDQRVQRLRNATEAYQSMTHRNGAREIRLRLPEGSGDEMARQLSFNSNTAAPVYG